jgi:tetraacyldisaccharide 4'-kinase
VYRARVFVARELSWSPRKWGARVLETGQFHGLVSRALASAFAPVAARGLVRPATIPSDVALVCVGGATLGGSGKTRVAVACARELARIHGPGRVVLVGHAYRAAPRSARVVAVDDVASVVGDEALICARALAGAGVIVVVGPTRQAALDHAAGLAPRPSVFVLDGPIRIRGRSRDQALSFEGLRPSSSPRALTPLRRVRALSILAVDANRPWGSGRLPPAGDLKAPRERLLAEADLVVPVDATPRTVSWPSGERASIESLRSARLGLFTAVARPDRLVRALATAGIRPREIVSVPDHGPLTSAIRTRLTRLAAAAGVDAWVGTPKCILHLEGLSLGVPVGILDDELLLTPPQLEALAAVG